MKVANRQPSDWTNLSAEVHLLTDSKSGKTLVFG